jgi:peptide/nickel transport system substrate-binding protein
MKFISGIALLTVVMMLLSLKQERSETSVLRKEDELTAVIEYSGSFFVPNFNPFIVTQRQTTANFIYEPLGYYNALHEGEFIPRLALRREFSKDLRRITYTLRQGVRWSDGRPFDADDVLFSLELVKKHPALDRVGLWKNTLKSVRKNGPYQVIFELAKPDSTVEWLIADQMIVPQHLWADVADPVTFTNPRPVGTGPFTEVRDFRPQLYKQCRNPYFYEKGRPRVDCLRFPQFSNNDQIQAALIKGEIDWASVFVPNIERVYVQKDPQHHKFWFPPHATVVYQLNTTRKPMNDLAFRRAFAMSMNRGLMIKIAGYGYPSPNPCPTGIGDFYKAWYDQAVCQKYAKYMEHRPTEAKKLLDEAGYRDRNGDGFRENLDGSPIELDIIVPNGWTDWVITVQMTTSFLAAVGIKARLITPEQVVWRNRLITGDFSVGIMSLSVGATPWLSYEQLLNPSYFGVHEMGAHRFKSDRAQQLLKAYGQTIDRNRQKKAVAGLQEIVAENLMVIPLFSNPGWYAYNTKRFEGWVSKNDPFVQPMTWWGVPERGIHVIHLYERGQKP